MLTSHLTSGYPSKHVHLLIPHSTHVSRPVPRPPLDSTSLSFYPTSVPSTRSVQPMPTARFSVSINLHQETLILLLLSFFWVSEGGILYHTMWHLIIFLGINSVLVTVLGTETTTMHTSQPLPLTNVWRTRKTSRQWQYKVVSDANGNQRAAWEACKE